jgi:hypothetical protein
MKLIENELKLNWDLIKLIKNELEMNLKITTHEL